jgi:hypothetical protein
MSTSPSWLMFTEVAGQVSLMVACCCSEADIKLTADLINDGCRHTWFTDGEFARTREGRKIGCLARGGVQRNEERKTLRCQK